MDLKLLLSPAQKDPEPDAASSQSSSREHHATDDRREWQYHTEDHPYEPQQQQHQHQPQFAQPHEPYQQQGQQHGQQHNQQQQPYYSYQENHTSQPLVPPILSISASTPMAEETQEPQQYFARTHRPAPPPVHPPPTGLNLSSYSFLLMEKRDREREAMERANRGYLMGETSSAKNDSAPSSPSIQHMARVPSPRIEPAQRAGYSSNHTSETRPYSHYQHPQQQQHPGFDRTPHGYHPDTARLPHQGYDASPQYHPSGPYHQQHPSYQGYGPAYSPPTQHGYPHFSSQHSYPQQHSHHYHSSNSTNIGQDPIYGRPQEYSSESQGSMPYQYYGSMAAHHRAMSPGLLDKPRFANANLSVFRQSAAEDSDGNASVSSSGSLKRRRRHNKVRDGKRSLPGSALGATSHGHYLMARTSSHGSAEGHEDFYDDDDEDSSDEHFDVRNGLQGLNLQKSIKTSVSERAKKSRIKTERPFKIGELVESMKSDTNGTWFAGRVLDLEDDPHDHINPKSVLIHFEGFSPHHDEWVKPSQLRACSTGSGFLRYGPNGHEPAESWTTYEKFYNSDLGRTARRHTGLAYDRRMLLHKCQCNTSPEERHHPEQPERLVEILCQFQKHGMLSLVKWIQGREATIEELVAAHTDTHVRNYCCTAAQNRQYALENGITDTDLQTEDDVEEEPEPEGEEEEEEEDNEATTIKSQARRGRPRKSHRGSILVPTTATIAPESNAAAANNAEAPQSEDVDMARSGSPTEANKDVVEVDLRSPALGRRRSSMRGSAIRMSSLVSMSSTLFAQKEEDMVPEDSKEAAPAIDEDDDDDDDKLTQAGPAPSEAALAVAGGMDPTLASRIGNSSQVIPKLEKDETGGIKAPAIGEKSIPSLGAGKTEDKSKVEKAAIPAGGISTADLVVGERRSPRNIQDHSVTIVAQSETPNAIPKSRDTGASELQTGDGAEQANKSKDKKTVEKADKVQKKKGHQAVSPAPGPTGDSSLIRPPGLTFTMTCGQLGIAVDTTWNPYHSSTAAKVAAGSLINLVDQVVTGRCKNGFAIIRPPGHHAEEDEAMGFCFFNNVGVAVNLTLSRYPLTIQKILIIDWDVHHGNGTQQIFYENPNVLYISLHRWDNGHFYPFTGAPDECGDEAGEGTNVNIAWSSYGRAQAMGDVEYIAAFWYVLLPIARQFQPDLVMVSAGFDAADGHAANIGGYTVSPQGFAILTRLVQTLAGGRVILSLEGGYEFEPLALSATACLEELLPHSLLPANAPTRAFPFASFQGTLNSVKPNAMAVSSLHQVLKYQQKYWKFPPEVLNPSFRFQLPAEWKATNSLATRPRRERNTRKRGPVLDS
ncbi:Histone deacetylase 4 [Mortierella sp. AD011]|nr:Histone deacetylase 4 [Mortierella sp. AD011]